MAYIASRGSEGFRELRRLHWNWRFKEEGCKNQRLNKVQVVRFQQECGQCIETAGHEANAEHGALF